MRGALIRERWVVGVGGDNKEQHGTSHVQESLWKAKLISGFPILDLQNWETRNTSR